MQRLILMGILMFGTVACSDSLATTISPTTISPTEKDPEIILTQVNFGQKSLLETQYFDIEFDEFQIGTNVRGMGGALIGDGEQLTVATAGGIFLGIDLGSLKVQDDYFPSLDMGSNEIGASDFIEVQETPPRVHDLLSIGDSYFVTFDRYDPIEDRVRFVLASTQKGSPKWSDLYISPPLDWSIFTLGSGGAMTYNEISNSLFFSIGDFSLDRKNGLPSDFAPQSNTLPWGHILKLDLETLKTEMYSKGHRNTLGLSFMADGQLISSENGPRGGDELNIIMRGKNYGWPFESYGTYYGSRERFGIPADLDQNQRFDQPIYTFIPSVAPSSLFQSRTFNESWKGNITMGSLRAESLFNIKIDGRSIIYVEQIKIGHRIRDVIELRDAIYCLTDSASIIRIMASEKRD